MVFVPSQNFSFMLALFIDDFENNDTSLSTTFVTMSNLWLTMMAGILAESIHSIFLPSPKSIYGIGMPKRGFLLIFITKVVNILSKPFFPPHCLTGSTV